VLWKAPYSVDITAVALAGTNRLEIEVTNTWVNRLAGDANLPPERRTTLQAAGGRGGGAGGPGGQGGAQQLLPAGLIGARRCLCR
jgi:hypothetical protein